ncbi:hypothetical protein HJFPF1_12421 [Paramyrothecium foliicola]|nr:hypothetical protein HJFPF1_12421 [Paramyrothecium foliicola]
MVQGASTPPELAYITPFTSQVIAIERKSLLAMALRDTDLPAEEAREILIQLQRGELGEINDIQSATFMADLTLANLDPRSAQVENMAEEFESMALFNEILERNRMAFSE